MAHQDTKLRSYTGLKANLSPLDADILERLVEKQYEPHCVIGALVQDGQMSESQAYRHVRRLLLNCMDKLHRGGQ